MEVISLYSSPCAQHAATTPTQPNDTILCVPSSSCCDCPGTSAGVRPPWLSVAVTADGDVCVQTMETDQSSDSFAARLREMRGVTVEKSSPHFARLACANLRDVVASHTDTLSFPLTSADVRARDVSSRSAVTHPAAGAAGSNGTTTRARSPFVRAAQSCCCVGPSVASKRAPPVTWAIAAPAQLVPTGNVSGHALLGSATRTTPAEARAAHVKVSKDADVAVSLACTLPTVVLLLSCSRWERRGSQMVLVLRPAIELQHRSYALRYQALLWPVSVSVRHVALRPDGAGVFVLADTLTHIASPAAGVAGDAAVVAEAWGGSSHVVVRGSYAALSAEHHHHDNSVRPVQLRPLLLHVGLCGSLSRQRHSLRALMRSRISGVWCRWCSTTEPLTQERGGAGRRPEVEVAVYTSEGHALVFQSIAPPSSGRSGGGAAAANATEAEAEMQSSPTQLYVCSFATRFSHAALSGVAPSDGAVAAAASLPRRHARNVAMLVAPPWRFLDQWCHSTWFRAALVSSGRYGHDAGAGGEAEEDGARGRSRRRHVPSGVLATSANRRVWLIGAGASLSLATVPSCMSDAVNGAPPRQTCAVQADAMAHSDAVLSPAVARLSESFALHDVQYVDSDSHAGFLLLGRHRCGGADEETGDAAGAALVGASSAPAAFSGRGRYVHAQWSSPLRFFFLSLLAVHGGRGSGPTPSAGVLHGLPLRCSSAVRSQLSAAFASPAHRLRIVSAAHIRTAVLSVPSPLFIAVGSGGQPRTVVAMSAELPSLWTWCATRLVSWPACGAGSAPRDYSPLPSRVRDCVLHALSAALPCAAAPPASEAAWAIPSAHRESLGSTPAQQLEAEVELALMGLRGPHAAVDAEDAGTCAFTDVLECTLNTFLDALAELSDWAGCGAAAPGSSERAELAAACVTAVFAGFSAALRMCGMVAQPAEWRVSPTAALRGSAEGTGASANQAGESAVTLRTLATLHRSAELLAGAMQRLCVAGCVSAVLACASHMTQTVQHAALEEMSVHSAAACHCTPPAVWRTLLQPLYDAAWVMVQDYGLPAEVTGGLLAYGSPAVQAMAQAGAVWCRAARTQIDAVGLGGAAHGPTSLSPAAGPPAPLLTSSAPSATAPTQPYAFSGAAAPLTPSVTPPASQSLPQAGTDATSSAELYERVRRVFLLQGPAAALRLVQELSEHEGTREGVAEMAHMYAAMQRRLDQLCA